MEPMISTGQIDNRVADVPAEVSPSAAVLSRPIRTLWTLLPWLLVAVAAGLVLHHYGTPDGATAGYAAYLVPAVVLPGTLVFRALWGSRGNWPEDLGLGAATGMVLQLVGWAIGAASGQHLILTAWPILILALFLAVPRLRRNWRIADPSPLPLAWSWLMAAVLLALVAWAAPQFRSMPLPPVTAQYYPDVYYHLSLIHEMMRSLPFQVPQLAGDSLRYHYLSDADMATASMVTHIAPTTVFLRLWILPVVATAAVATAALTRTVVPRWWAGPVAAAVAFAGQPLYGNSPISFGTQPISLLSPSQSYAMPLLALFALVVVEKLRGDRVARGWAGWAALPVLAVACAGAKSSALPPLLAGVLLAGLYLWWRRRTIPWAAAGPLASVAFGMAVGFRLFAGGGAGTLGLQPLSLLRWLQPYSQTLGIDDGVGRDGLFPPGMQHAGGSGLLFVAILVAWLLLMEAPRLIGLVVPGRTGTGDPAPFLLGGMILAGLGGALLLWHPAASQVYFFNGAVPFGVVLAVRAVALRSRGGRVLAPGAVAGALWMWLGLRYRPPSHSTIHSWQLSLVVPVLVAAGAAVVLAAIGVAIWRRRALRAVPVALLAAVLGGSLAANLEVTARAIHAHHGPVPLRAEVTAPEMRAARWLDQNAGADDVVATNVHCMPMNVKDSKNKCDARAFWVAGLGGRRSYIESWAYSDQAVGANGVNGLKYMYQPAPYPDRYSLNQRVFATGDAASVAELRAQGVKWLFADTRAGQVAPALAQVAHVSYTAGPVTIYQLNAVS
jgi:hypothetical protein